MEDKGSLFGRTLTKPKDALELDDFKRIALESLTEEEREKREDIAQSLAVADIAPDDADAQVERVVTEVEVIDREMDELQGQMNQLAVRKVLLQRTVETLLADVAEEFGLVAHFARGDAARERTGQR